MQTFVVFSLIALLCYLILLLAFLAAKKNKIINAFIILLIVFIMWTTGSFGMRIGLFPSTSFWFYLSIDGLFLLPPAFFNFITVYIGDNSTFFKKFWFGWSLFIIAVNHLTSGFIIAAPHLETTGNSSRFVYDLGIPVLIPAIFTILVIAHILIQLFRFGKSDEMARNQFLPIGIGIFVLFLGNLATVLPLFKGFPIDILSGVVNAFFMFYALYRRHLFRLTLLVSRSTCYIISGILAIILFCNLIDPMQYFVTHNLPLFAEHSVLIIAVTFTLSTLLFYSLLKHFFDKVFIRDEIIQANYLKDFTTQISHTLNVNDVLQLLIEVIQNTMDVEKVYICVKDFSGDGYRIQESSSPLDERSMFIRNDNPLAIYLEANKQCVLVQDLRRTSIYRSMWELEKNQLATLGIQCVLPLLDGNDLVGIALLSNKARNTKFSYDDMNFLDSLASVSSVAVKNSRLYEKAFMEARTDELTGLLNRKYFYEVLEKSYQETLSSHSDGKELALLIINLDDFKLFNQLYGNIEGDVALQNVSHIISGSVGNHGHVARYGGKEFAVILPGFDILSANNLAETIRSQIMNMNRQATDYAMKMLTASCGICAIPSAASDLKQLVNNTDMAVYNAKRRGKNCTVIYSAGQPPIIAEKSLDVVEGTFKPNVYDEYAATIHALTAAIDVKDHYTYSHSQNVCYYATELARAYNLNADCVEIVKEAALLHDIGKIGIPESILQKPSKLTPDEFEIMKSHVEQSINIIRHLPSLDYVIPAVLGHHERYDGKGYPRQLKGQNIPLLARVLCVADSFDAMVSKRPYKSALDINYALSQLEDNSGTQFDPELAKLFIQLVNTHVITVR